MILYSADELTSGYCEICGDYSNEIDPETGCCIDCLESGDHFYEEPIKRYNDEDPFYRYW